MLKPNHIIAPQPLHRQPEIEIMLDQVFGLSRQTKASYRLREGEQAVAGLSFIMTSEQDELLGAISFWNLRIGEAGTEALLLGPLAVDPAHRGQGIGRELMQHGLEKATDLGHRLVILVGDEPYYARVGFKKVPDGQLLMPGPVDVGRLLYLELADGTLARAKGLVLSPRRYKS
ncbi:MAG: N-acetyltransferase [Hyphomicrobiales bacterium]|nr:N-acetyltransferase [Hyphomicrobiales bacterium]